MKTMNKNFYLFIIHFSTALNRVNNLNEFINGAKWSTKNDWLYVNLNAFNLLKIFHFIDLCIHAFHRLRNDFKWEVYLLNNKQNARKESFRKVFFLFFLWCNLFRNLFVALTLFKSSTDSINSKHECRVKAARAHVLVKMILVKIAVTLTSKDCY